ncbi:MAG: hypothetical protein ABIT37_03780 [Luteolibacter sp.]
MKTRTNNGAVIDLEDKPSKCLHGTYAGDSLIRDKGFIYSQFECIGCGKDFGEEVTDEDLEN